MAAPSSHRDLVSKTTAWLRRELRVWSDLDVEVGQLALRRFLRIGKANIGCPAVHGRLHGLARQVIRSPFGGGHQAAR